MLSTDSDNSSENSNKSPRYYQAKPYVNSNTHHVPL